MQCKICHANAKKIFNKILLHKYEVEYWQCPDCAYIFTEPPFWLQEAYSCNQSIVTSDTGIMSRNINAAKFCNFFLMSNGYGQKKWGGGN